MWIYVYKFDKHARLVKCKARIVVRGDQQSRSKMESTYAATLAARSFRTFMAIAARFDLELKQYDAVNAFVHAALDEDIYMKKPPEMMGEVEEIVDLDGGLKFTGLVKSIFVGQCFTNQLRKFS